MDNNYTAMLLVVDRSGSMASIRTEVEESLAGLIASQAKEPGLTTVDVVTFDTEQSLDYQMAAPEAVKILIEPRGGTALLDTLFMSIEGFSKSIAALPEHAQPGKKIVVVATDGEENSSTLVKHAAVKELVKSKQNHDGFEMVFLGANQDAVLEGTNLGFQADASLTFDADSMGVASMAQAASRFVSDARSGHRKGFTEAERDSASRGDN